MTTFVARHPTSVTDELDECSWDEGRAETMCKNRKPENVEASDPNLKMQWHTLTPSRKKRRKRIDVDSGHYTEVLSTCKRLCTTTMIWYDQTKAYFRGGERIKLKEK